MRAERIRRPRYGSLEIEVTVNDPKAYTSPWTIRLDQTIVVDTGCSMTTAWRTSSPRGG